MVTSRDVAKLAGVSVATVSRVYANSNVVTDSTAKKVLDAASQLGYIPNTVARSLKSNRSKTIGLVITNIFNPVFYQVASIMTAELEKYDYKVILSFNSTYERSLLKNLQTLLAARTEAIAFTPLFEDSAVFDLLNTSGVYPLQILGNAYSQFDSVMCDDYGATCRLTQYLIDRGHHNIMLICPTEDRKEGLLHTLAANAIVVTEGNYISPLPAEYSSAIIERAIIKYRPSAIIAVTQDVLTSLMIVLKNLHYRIPDDISVVAYDDNPLAEYENITVIGHDIQYIGEEMARFLLNHLLGRKPPEDTPHHILLETNFIERSSVKNIR
ncbi:MAG: LacI family transcriptional regulator [Lachnospiraceae bacterium]|nr:LacI family transcriptional regulator [Lachnospiraceae bacterium]